MGKRSESSNQGQENQHQSDSNIFDNSASLEAHAEFKSHKIAKKYKSKSEKQKEQQKEKKNKRQFSGAKIGRPKLELEEQLEVYLDPTSIIQQKILQHLEKIGLKHGLVFRQSDRIKLIKQNQKATRDKKINWKASHDWDKVQEKSKIAQNSFLQNIIKDFTHLNTKFTQEQIVEIFLCVGSIVADECTQQIYTIFAHNLQSIILKQQPSARQQRAQDLFQKIRFMNGNFTNCKIDNWIAIHKVKPSVKKQSFKQMFHEIYSQTNQMFEKNVQEIKSFIRQENQMEEKLNQIIGQFQFQMIG